MLPKSSFAMKTIALTILLLPSFLLFGQNDFIIVDYEQIGQNISDSNSLYYYPRLMTLFEAGDTSLTYLDYFHLYYGATLQEGWSSMERFEDEEVRQIMRKREPSRDELLKAGSALESYLSEAPFDLEERFQLMIVADQLGEAEKFEKLKYQLQGLVAAIMETGDGLDVETAIHVNKVPDEYFILSILGFQYSGEQSLVYPCDYLKVEENEYEVEGLYFNVEQHFASLEQMLGQSLEKSDPVKSSDKKEKKKGRKQKN